MFLVLIAGWALIGLALLVAGIAFEPNKKD